MSDLIDRQAAIDALKEHRALYCDNTPEPFSKLSYVEKSRVDELDTAIATLVNLPSAQPETDLQPTCNQLATDLISRQAAIEEIANQSRFSAEEIINICDKSVQDENGWLGGLKEAIQAVIELPSAQPERLTDDDFETIRIHLSAYKERLCNQRRWKEAEEYQRIINRFMSFASAQPEQIPEHSVWFRIGETLVSESKGDITAEQAVEKIRDYLKRMEKPERKKGKWLLSDEQRREDTDNGNYLYFCSNCLRSDVHAKTQEVPYCWWCGADMRGE